jgi:hypothetical protein
MRKIPVGIVGKVTSLPAFIAKRGRKGIGLAPEAIGPARHIAERIELITLPVGAGRRSTICAVQKIQSF